MKMKIVAISFFLLSLTCNFPTHNPPKDTATTQLTSTGDCSWFTWSRSSPKIAVSRKSDLWIFDAGSLKWEQITSRSAGGPTIGRSTWSPDGTQLVCEADAGLLFRLDVASKDTTLLPIHGSLPRWSVDGRSLFFVHDGFLAQYSFATQAIRDLFKFGYGDYDLFPDSNGVLLLKPITYFNLKKGELKTLIGPYAGLGAGALSISPDGEHFAYDNIMVDNSIGEPQDPIRIFSISDSSMVDVPYTVDCDSPGWSHDSKRIAYLYMHNIWVKDLATFMGM